MSTADFYRDLFVGGYFKPDEFLFNKTDASKVYEAITIIEEYKKTLEENYLIESI